jgi:hypothetical protein
MLFSFLKQYIIMGHWTIAVKHTHCLKNNPAEKGLVPQVQNLAEIGPLRLDQPASLKEACFIGFREPFCRVSSALHSPLTSADSGSRRYGVAGVFSYTFR